MKDIHYDTLETQQYMKSQLFTNEEVNLLFAIRSRMIDCKSNFKSKYNKDDLTCRICHKAEENQFHILHCKVLNDVLKSNDIILEQVKYDDTRISGPSGPVNSSSCGGHARFARKTHSLK